MALNISETNQSLSGQLNHLPKSDNGQHIALWCCTVTMLVNYLNTHKRHLDIRLKTRNHI
ncbi:MAG: hypothetical protein RLZZ442_1471 [Cyanobacteriota bacterium]